MLDSVTITLTSEERQRARAWADALNAKYEANPQLARVWNPGTDRHMHWMKSAEAELAAARHFGLCDPDWQIHVGHGDRGVDTWTKYGQPVQVKYRSKPGGLMATNSLDFHEELQADYYVLTWPGRAEGEFQVVGWCTRDEYLRRVLSRPPVTMRGRKYEMKLDELHSAVEGLPDA